MYVLSMCVAVVKLLLPRVSDMCVVDGKFGIVRLIWWHLLLLPGVIGKFIVNVDI